MSLANAKKQLLEQYWMTLLHHDWSDLCDGQDGWFRPITLFFPVVLHQMGM